jgi:hypothetical protein
MSYPSFVKKFLMNSTQGANEIRKCVIMTFGMTVTQKPNEQSQDAPLTEQQPVDETTRSAVKVPSYSFFLDWSNRTHLFAVGLLLIVVLGIGYLLLQSNQPDQVSVTPTPAVQSSPTPTAATTSPTASPSASLQPSTQPAATKKPAPPTPTPSPKSISGVEMRFSDVHFYAKPEPGVTFTPFRVANGGSITVPNEKNASEFELYAIYVNHGSDESKNIWVHYYVDGVEVGKGIAYLPGNMVRDELVTRDSAQPVKIPASGSHAVKIVIDPENQSNDVNHANNTYTFTYTVK